MTSTICRAPRSAVMKLRESRSFVTFLSDTASLGESGRVAQKRSCTPERLRP